MPTFIAHRISADHNVLFPDRIDVDENRVVYYKGALIGYSHTEGKHLQRPPCLKDSFCRRHHRKQRRPTDGD